MAQKIIKIGSSAGITLSRDTLTSIGAKVGDLVEVVVHPKTHAFSARIKTAPESAEVNPDVIVWTNAFIDKNRALLKRLADE